MTCRSCGETQKFPGSQGWTPAPGVFLKTAAMSLLIAEILIVGALATAAYFDGRLVPVALVLFGAIPVLVAIGSLGGCLLSWLEYSVIPESMKTLFICERCGMALPVYPWTR